MKTIISLDNGVTGTVSVIKDNQTFFIETPNKRVKSYQKTKDKYIHRIDFKVLKSYLEPFKENSICVVERPMINPGRWDATVSAIRALEATSIILEELGIEYEFIDSKIWQHKYLPEGIKGSKFLKRASMEVGILLFPEHKELIVKHGDADALFIAKWKLDQGV
jgi:hypothetical protein